MALWLKQSTSVDVAIGPFVDATDGVTAETTLTLTQPDVRLKKNAGAWAQKAAAQSLSHEENGWYEVTLDTTDTDTLGLLRLAVHESGALPVFHDFLVVTANVYDSLFSTDKLQVDVVQWEGADASDTSATWEAEPGHTAADVWAVAVRQLTTEGVEAIVAAVLDELLAGHATAGSLGQAITDILVDTGTTLDGKLDTIDTTVDAILVDTGTTLDGKLDAIDDLLDTEVAALTSAVAELPTTAEFEARTLLAADYTVVGDLSGITATLGDNSIDADTLAADLDTYQAKLFLWDDDANATDRYTVAWHKNGHPYRTSGGITSPTIQVVAIANGIDLIAATAMTEIGATELYRYSATTSERLTDGVGYVAIVTATIDGAVRESVHPVGRDSEA